GRLIAPVNLGRGARRGLDAVYRRIDATIAGREEAASRDDMFEIPTRLSRARQRRLDSRLDLLAGSGAAVEAVETLRLYLANAPDQEVARIKPLAVARRFGVDETALTDACLRAVHDGLLELQWDVICPLCRIPSGHRDTLREVREHENC